MAQVASASRVGTRRQPEGKLTFGNEPPGLTGVPLLTQRSKLEHHRGHRACRVFPKTASMKVHVIFSTLYEEIVVLTSLKFIGMKVGGRGEECKEGSPFFPNSCSTSG